MKNKYALAVVAIVAISLLSVGLASAHSSGEGSMMNSNGMHNMVRGMHASGMMQGGFAHDKESIEQMREEMKEHHADLTDEEISKMMEGCPMMRTA